jgi:hypothetical protein
MKTEILHKDLDRLEEWTVVNAMRIMNIIAAATSAIDNDES